MKIIELKIKGMTCASCSAAVERALEDLSGINDRQINHASDSGRIRFDETKISPEEIIAKINETHYQVIGQEHIQNTVFIPQCPQCQQEGELVPNSIFKSILNRDSKDKVDHAVENYICMNSDCDTAYYTQQSSIDILHLRRPIWFKKSSQKKIICYCNNIDREMIKESVQQKGLHSWEEITGHYRSKVIERCELLNPTGSCCRSTFEKVVGTFEG